MASTAKAGPKSFQPDLIVKRTVFIVERFRFRR
jgi:hypothetical protein